MRAEYINPFILSTIDVFDTMAGCSLSRGNPFLKEGTQPEHEITGIIGYTGHAEGCVVISLSLQLALKAASVMLDREANVVDQDVVDTVGELANMIAGQAKKHLESLELRVSLPTVMTGKSHSIGYPRGVVPICIPFTSTWGAIVDLSTKRTDVGVSHVVSNDQQNIWPLTGCVTGFSRDQARRQKSEHYGQLKCLMNHLWSSNQV